MNFCPNCGNKLESEDVYCSNCGFKIKNNSLSVDDLSNNPVEHENGVIDTSTKLFDETPQNLNKPKQLSEKGKKLKLISTIFTVLGILMFLSGFLVAGLGAYTGKYSPLIGPLICLVAFAFLFISSIVFSSIKKLNKWGKTYEIL